MTRKIQQLTLALLLAGLALTLTLTPTQADNPPTFVLMWGSGVDTGASAFEICTTDTLPCQAGNFAGTGNGELAFPTGVAVDSSGNVYVVDSGHHRIQKFDSNGNYLAKWGTPGSGNGQFSTPYGVAVDSSDNIYVTDRDNDRVQKFDSDGNFITKWGTTGNNNSEFNSPYGIAIDSSNNVYVVDNGNSRIQKFDSNGGFQTEWGSPGSGDFQFSSPLGIAVDSSNNVYVADNLNLRVQKFNSTGTILLDTWNSGEFLFPFAVTVDGEDNVYVSEKIGNARVHKFDSSGTLLTTWGSPGSGAGQFNGPNDVAVDSDGNIYVVEESNHRVQKFEQHLLAITKSVNNDTPRSGDRITYTISVHNGGAISATNAVISDTLPAGLTFAGPVGLEGSSGTVAQDAGDLPALASNVTITDGSTITVTFPVTVNAGLAPNTVINNTAAVTSSEESTPQTASTLITVNAVDLNVLKIPSKIEDHFPNPGQLITYTIFVTNSGIISATNAVVSDTLPDGLTFAGPVELAGSSGTVAQDAGDLPTLASGLTIPNGASIQVTLPVTVDTGQDHGTLIFNVAAVTSDEVTSPEYGLGITIVLSDTLPPIFPSNPLITPTQGITLDTLFPIFEWYAALDNGQVLTYLLTLSSTLDVLSAQSTSISFTTSQTSFVSPIALSKGDYFWTVQAQDAAGNVNSPPIPSQSFTIVADSRKTYLPLIIKND